MLTESGFDRPIQLFRRFGNVPFAAFSVTGNMVPVHSANFQIPATEYMENGFEFVIF
jgi:hypothetical protein